MNRPDGMPVPLAPSDQERGGPGFCPIRPQMADLRIGHAGDLGIDQVYDLSGQRCINLPGLQCRPDRCARLRAKEGDQGDQQDQSDPLQTCQVGLWT